jgi:hypothetical protein
LETEAHKNYTVAFILLVALFVVIFVYAAVWQLITYFQLTASNLMFWSALGYLTVFVVGTALELLIWGRKTK